METAATDNKRSLRAYSRNREVPGNREKRSDRQKSRRGLPQRPRLKATEYTVTHSGGKTAETNTRSKARRRGHPQHCKTVAEGGCPANGTWSDLVGSNALPNGSSSTRDKGAATAAHCAVHTSVRRRHWSQCIRGCRCTQEQPCQGDQAESRIGRVANAAVPDG